MATRCPGKNRFATGLYRRRGGSTAASFHMRRQPKHLGARNRLGFARSRSARLILTGAALVGAWLVLEPHAVRAGRDPAQRAGRGDPNSAVPRLGTPSSSRLSEADPTLSPARRQVLDTLAGYVRGARAVIDIRREGGDIDLILWTHDAAPFGLVDAHEVAVICFRASLKTIILYEYDSGTANPAVALACEDVPPVLFGAGSGVIEGWKLRPDVRSNILAADVSDVLITPWPAQDVDVAVLRIDLKWSPDRADVAHRGTAYVAAALMRRQAKEFFN